MGIGHEHPAAGVVTPPLFAGERVQRVDQDPIRGPHPCRDIDHPVGHEGPGPTRPARDHAPVPQHLAAVKSGAGRPHELAVRRTKASDNSVVACEVSSPIVDLRREPHGRVRGENPADLPTRDLEGPDRIVCGGSEEEQVPGHHGLEGVVEVHAVHLEARLRPGRTRRLRADIGPRLA